MIYLAPHGSSKGGYAVSYLKAGLAVCGTLLIRRCGSRVRTAFGRGPESPVPQRQRSCCPSLRLSAQNGGGGGTNSEQQGTTSWNASFSHQLTQIFTAVICTALALGNVCNQQPFFIKKSVVLFLLLSNKNTVFSIQFLIFLKLLELTVNSGEVWILSEVIKFSFLRNSKLSDWWPSMAIFRSGQLVGVSPLTLCRRRYENILLAVSGCMK